MHWCRNRSPGLPSCLLIVATLVVGSSLRAIARAETPAERLTDAIASSSLDTPGLKPWHLSLAVTVYDEAGKNPVTGTIERWQTPDATRTVYTFGDATLTHLDAGGKSYSMHTGPAVPALADAILEETLHPGPYESDLQGVEPELRQQDLGTAKLDCIMLVRIMSRPSTIPLGLFPTYCLSSGDNRLRISYNFGSYTVLRNGMGTFQGRSVATVLTLKDEKITLAEARMTSLAVFTPTPDQFTPDPAMQAAAIAAARVSGGLMAGLIVSHVPPQYPESARAAYIGGTVVLRAIISRDGHIRSLRPMSGPEADLTIAALDAVRQWRYKPYLLNGEPTEVDTTITVNFNLN